jgi:hypothetical protein
MADASPTPDYTTGGNVMLAEINRFVNWAHHRNLDARTWRDYRYHLKQFSM